MSKPPRLRRKTFEEVLEILSDDSRVAANARAYAQFYTPEEPSAVRRAVLRERSHITVLQAFIRLLGYSELYAREAYKSLPLERREKLDALINAEIKEAIDLFPEEYKRI